MPATIYRVNPPAGTGTVSYTGLGFRPDLLISMANVSTVEGNSASAQIGIGFGIAGSGIGFNYEELDNDAVPNVTHQMLEKAILGAGSCAADIVTLDADGFTLDWTSVGTAQTVQILAIGGAGLEAYVDWFDSSLSSGDQSITGVGFEPEVVLFIHTNRPNFVQSGTDVGNCFIGAADGITEWGMGMEGEFVGASDSREHRVFKDDACIFSLAEFGPNQIQRQWSFVSMDSDGFTINTGTTSAGVLRVGFIAIRDDDFGFIVGTETQKTTTGTKTTTTGETSDALLLSGGNCDVNVTGHGSSVNGRFFLGLGASDLEQGANAMGTEDAADPSEAAKLYSESSILASVSPSETTEVEANLQSIGSDGFTLDYTTVDGASPRYFGWVQFRARPEEPFIPQFFRLPLP